MEVEQSGEVAGGASGNALDDDDVVARVAKVASDHDFGDGSDERNMAVMDARLVAIRRFWRRRRSRICILRPEAGYSPLSEP